MSLFQIEWLSFWRQKGEWLNASLLLWVFCVLFAMSSQNGSAVFASQEILPLLFGLVFVNQLVIDGHFRSEKQQGSWSHYLISEMALGWILLLKLICFYMLLVLPLTVMLPMLAVMMGWSAAVCLHIWAILLLLLPTIVALAMVCAAMTINLSRPSALFCFIMMPLLLPILLLTQSALQQSNWVTVETLILGALSAFCIGVLPHVTAFLMKATYE